MAETTDPSRFNSDSMDAEGDGTPVGHRQAPAPTPPDRAAAHAGPTSGGGEVGEAHRQPNFDAGDDPSGEQDRPLSHDNLIRHPII